jgi:hypothetical protein
VQKAYEDLFIAIWEEAIRADFSDAVKQVCDYAFKIAYGKYSLNKTEPLEKGSAEIKKIRQDIYWQSKKSAEELIPIIRKLVHKESKEWPNNSYINKDPGYSVKLRQLKKDVLEFAFSLNWPN